MGKFDGCLPSHAIGIIRTIAAGVLDRHAVWLSQPLVSENRLRCCALGVKLPSRFYIDCCDFRGSLQVDRWYNYDCLQFRWYKYDCLQFRCTIFIIDCFDIKPFRLVAFRIFHFRSCLYRSLIIDGRNIQFLLLHVAALIDSLHKDEARSGTRFLRQSGSCWFLGYGFRISLNGLKIGYVECYLEARISTDFSCLLFHTSFRSIIFVAISIERYPA